MEVKRKRSHIMSTVHRELTSEFVSECFVSPTTSVDYCNSARNSESKRKATIGAILNCTICPKHKKY